MGMSEEMEKPLDPAFLSETRLADTFRAAQKAHHQLETVGMKGVHDAAWPIFYAGFTLGRLGDFATPTELTAWLQEPVDNSDWHANAAKNVLAHLKTPGK